MDSSAPEMDDAPGPLWRVIAALPDRRDDVLAVVNGAVGDRLHATGSRLDLAMSLRLQGRAIDGRGAVPQAAEVSPDLVVLVHGLMCNETFWRGVGRQRPCYGERLQADVGATPVHVRYNSGLHISINGRRLSAALDELVGAWPVPVRSVSLIGHSMGGLVARSATHYGAAAGASWCEHLERIFLLGVPQRGAPLEQLTSVATFVLRTIPNPWTLGISWLLRQRSAGIKDLRHGYLVDEEWVGRESDALSFGRRHLVELPAGVRHYAIAGALPERSDHPMAHVLGDMMVAPWSAKDQRLTGQPVAGAATSERVFPGVGHMGLVNHDGVYQQIRQWW